MSLDSKFGLEESILKICMSDKSIGTEIAYSLKPEEFQESNNKKIFMAFKEAIIDESYTDDISFISSIEDEHANGWCKQILENNEGNTNNWKLYCEKLQYIAQKKKIKEFLQEKEKDCDTESTVDEIIADINDIVIKMSSESREYELEDMGKIYEKIEPQIGTEQILDGFVDLGIGPLNNFIGPLYSHSYVCIGARPSMGKTALIIEMMRRLSIDNTEESLCFSLETGRRSFVFRLIANLSGVPINRIKDPNLTQEEKAKILAVREKLINSKIRFADIYDTSIEQILSVSRREKLKRPNLKYIFIDYLQLIAYDKEETRNHQITYISRALKMLAKEINVVIINVAQLNRGLESREDKRPMLSDLRESGSIEQDADLVMFLYRDEYYNKGSAMTGTVEIIIAKNKESQTGTINMRTNLECNQFLELGEFEI